MEKERLLISACLYGEECRYDGKSNRLDGELLSAIREKYELIPVCPEVLGGLPTPRVPSERVGDRVIMKDGTDVTANFIHGAKTACKIAAENGAKLALLKERSPSCGCGKIYDGTFTGTLTVGNGVAAEALICAGLQVLGEAYIEKLLKKD